MTKAFNIAPPKAADDNEGAERFLEEFAELYQPTLISAQKHLHVVITRMEPQYADAYTPWYTALNEITRGIHMLSKNIPLPDMERFIDALYMFTFEGAIQFLSDLCRNCKIQLERNWEKHFREHISMLLFAIAILSRQQVPGLAR